VALFLSVFETVSIVNVNIGAEAGIAPCYFALAIACFQILIRKRSREIISRKPYLPPAAFLGAFGIYALLSAAAFPFIFEGVTVNGARSSVHLPLVASFTNLAQSLYLIICLATYFIVTFRADSRLIKKTINWYVHGSIVAGLICIYQWCSANFGLPFPKEFLFTNPTHAIFDAYDLGGVIRVNGTFTEASFAAVHLAPALALAAWPISTHRFRTRDIAKSLAILIPLLLTFSSTAYLCLLLIAAFVIPPLMNLRRGGKQVAVFKAGAALAIGLLVLRTATNEDARLLTQNVIDSVLLEKSSSHSFEERTAGNLAALSAAKDTHLLGVGWGSLRAFSLFFQILGTVGIPGLSLFSIFCVFLLRPSAFTRVHSLAAYKRVSLSTAVALFAFALSVPDFGYPFIWVLFGAANAFHPRSRSLESIAMQHRITAASQTGELLTLTSP
jgi:hypothetical protein